MELHTAPIGRLPFSPTAEIGGLANRREIKPCQERQKGPNTSKETRLAREDEGKQPTLWALANRFFRYSHKVRVPKDFHSRDLILQQMDPEIEAVYQRIPSPNKSGSSDPYLSLNRLKLDEGEQTFRLPSPSYPSHHLNVLPRVRDEDMTQTPYASSSSSESYSHSLPMPVPEGAEQQGLAWSLRRDGISASQHPGFGGRLLVDNSYTRPTALDSYPGYYHYHGPSTGSSSSTFGSPTSFTSSLRSDSDSPTFPSTSSSTPTSTPTSSSGRRRTRGVGPVVSYRGIGIAEAERILRSVHNLPYGVPISLSALPDPLPGMKPRQSYNTLVQIAIWESREKRLTLKGIYEALERRFSWCRDHPDSRKWKNSIRHMLSNRNVFVLVREEEWDRGGGGGYETQGEQVGRGGWWELDFGDVEGSRRGERRQRKRRAMSKEKSRDGPGDEDVEGEEDVSEAQEGEHGYETPTASTSTSAVQMQTRSQRQTGRSVTSVSGGIDRTARPVTSITQTQNQASFSTSLLRSSDRTFRMQSITSCRGTDNSWLSSSDLARSTNSSGVPGDVSGPVLFHPTGRSSMLPLETPTRNQHYERTLPVPRSSMPFQEQQGAFYQMPPFSRRDTLFPPLAYPDPTGRSPAPFSYYPYPSPSAIQSAYHTAHIGLSDSSRSIHGNAPPQSDEERERYPLF